MNTQINGQCIGSLTKYAYPGFGIFIFGREGTDACLAFDTKEGICFERLRLCEKGRVKITQRHDEFLSCVAGSWKAIENSTPTCVLLELLHVYHCYK